MITYRDTQTENTIDRLPLAQDQLRAHLAEIEGFEPNFVVYLNGEERLMIDAECEKVPSLATAAICADMEDALLVLDRHAGNRAAQWTVEFSEYCGYDSMTHAWKINGPKNRIYIDCANFGQKSCDYDDQESIAKAKAFADHVCAALNAYHP